MKILILSHQGLGDIVMSLPIYSNIRDRFPDAVIYSTVKTQTERELLSDQKMSDNFIMSDFYNMTFFQRLSFLREVLLRRFDIIIAPVGINVKYAIILRLLSVSKSLVAPKFNGLLSIFLNHPVVIHEKAKRVYNNQLIAKEFSEKESVPEITPFDKSEIFDRIYWPEHRRIIGIHPGSGVVEKHKRWPEEYYVELISKLSDQDVYFVIFGTESESYLADRIVSSIANRNVVQSLCGHTSIMETIFLISKCDSVISGDSGIMHIASAINVATYSIFGPTSSCEIAPYWNRGKVISCNLPCSPCYPTLITGCNQPECMSKVMPPSVIDVINKH